MIANSIRGAFRTGMAVPSLAVSRFAGPRMAPRMMPMGGLMFRRLLSDETRDAIQKAVESAPVVLFMKGTPEQPMCGFSRAVINLLGYEGVDPAKFAAFNVLEDDSLRQGIKEFSEWPTIPQLYINGEFIGGHDIINSMTESGDLYNMLKEGGYLAPEEESA